jgi:hypothetical protein
MKKRIRNVVYGPPRFALTLEQTADAAFARGLFKTRPTGQTIQNIEQAAFAKIRRRFPELAVELSRVDGDE